VAYLSVAVCGNIAGGLMEAFSSGKVIKDTVVIYPVSSYAAVFMLSLVIAVLALAAGFMLPETHGQNLYKLERMNRRKHKESR